MDSEIIGALIASAAAIISAIIGGWVAIRIKDMEIKAREVETGQPIADAERKSSHWIWGVGGAVMGAGLVCGFLSLTGGIPILSAPTPTVIAGLPIPSATPLIPTDTPVSVTQVHDTPTNTPKIAPTDTPTSTPKPTKTPTVTPTKTRRPTNTPSPIPTPPATLTQGQSIISEDFEDGVAEGFRFFDDCWKIVGDETGNKVLQCDNVSLQDGSSGVIVEQALRDFILEYRVRLIRFSDANPGQGLMTVNIREFPFDEWQNRYVIAFIPKYQDFGFFYQGKDTDDKWVEPGSQQNSIDWTIPNDKWFAVRAEIQNTSFVLWLDGKKVIEVDDDKAEKGRITFGIGPNTSAEFDDIRIWEIAP